MLLLFKSIAMLNLLNWSITFTVCVCSRIDFCTVKMIVCVLSSYIFICHLSTDWTKHNNNEYVFLQTERKIRIGENIAREMSTPSLTYADSNAKRQTYRTTVKNATKRTIQTKEECERHINIYNWTWMLHAYSHVKLDHFEIQIRGIPSRWFFL